MAHTVSKSRTFAVIIQEATRFKIIVLVKKTVLQEGRIFDTLPTANLEKRTVILTPLFLDRDALIELLVQAGLTVRFYDPEEKQWMDRSLVYGVVRAPGARDGQWGEPDLPEFERDYLPIM